MCACGLCNIGIVYFLSGVLDTFRDNSVAHARLRSDSSCDTDLHSYGSPRTDRALRSLTEIILKLSFILFLFVFCLVCVCVCVCVCVSVCVCVLLVCAVRAACQCVPRASLTVRQCVRACVRVTSVCVCVCVCFGLAQRRDQYSIEYFFPAMNDVPESRGYRY